MTMGSGAGGGGGGWPTLHYIWPAKSTWKLPNGSGNAWWHAARLKKWLLFGPGCWLNSQP